MESPPNKPESSAGRADVPPRYLPFLEAGFWPGASPISPFLIGRDIPPFWPVPWLPHLWSSGHPTVKHQERDSATRPQLSSSSSVVTSPNPEGSQVSSEPLPQPFRTPSLSNSPVLNGASSFSSHRGRSLVDPIIALTSIEASSPVISRALASALPRRPRSEKRPIPDEQKDDKYFERRKRNNMAAKKSRDARKQREDEIALRACFLEKENAVLRAQVATLREEGQSLRQMLLLQKRHGEWCKQ